MILTTVNGQISVTNENGKYLIRSGTLEGFGGFFDKSKIRNRKTVHEGGNATWKYSVMVDNLEHMLVFMEFLLIGVNYKSMTSALKDKNEIIQQCASEVTKMGFIAQMLSIKNE